MLSRLCQRALSLSGRRGQPTDRRRRCRGRAGAELAFALAVLASPPSAAAALRGPTAFELETLEVAREANGIARATLAQQGETAWWQLVLGAATVVFTAVAAGAAVLAARYAGRAADESRRSADVAVSLLTSHERPFLLLEVVESGITVGPDSAKMDVTKYRFRNLGRAPAILTRRHFHIARAEDMPEAIDPAQVGQPVVHGVAVAANDRSEILETSPALPIESALRDARKRQRDTRGKIGNFYFLGFVEYRDLAGRAFITGFCFKHIDNELGFQPLGMSVDGGPDLYNYDRAVTARDAARSGAAA